MRLTGQKDIIRKILNGAPRTVRPGFRVVTGSAPLAIRENLPSPLFRYTKKRWADAFFATGAIRLNTLLGYKKFELFNAAIGDAHEGQTVFYRYVPQPGLLPVRVNQVVTVRNQWTVCLSGARNDARMLPEFEADACYSVDSPKFFEAIHAALGDKTSGGFVDRVVYVPDDPSGINEAKLPPEQGNFAGSFKRDTYSYQNEVRACWETELPPDTAQAVQALSKPRHLQRDGRSLRDVANSDPTLQALLASEQARMGPLDIVVPDAVQYCTRIL